MREQSPQPQSPESILSLQYPAGWQEILTALDAIDYQAWMGSLTAMTQQLCAESDTPPEWAGDTEAVTSRWKRTVELVADASIDPTDELTEAERIEAGLLTLQANIESMGWEEEGLSFIVPNLITGEEAVIDLREMQSVPEANG
jgi:hypothetical protein